MNFRTLVQKKLRCAYAPLSLQEEVEITAVIRNREGVNRVLGKPVKAGASPEYQYYIAMCHVKQEHEGGMQLLLSCADSGCGAAWWELSLLSYHPLTQMGCRAKSYSLGCSSAVDYANKDLEVFSSEVITLITTSEDEDSRYIKALLMVAHQPAMSHLVEVLDAPYISSKVQVEEKDKESVRALLRQALNQADPDDEDYEYTVGKYESIVENCRLE